jgi:hypothetical protein
MTFGFQQHRDLFFRREPAAARSFGWSSFGFDRRCQDLNAVQFFSTSAYFGAYRRSGGWMQKCSPVTHDFFRLDHIAPPLEAMGGQPQRCAIVAHRQPGPLQSLYMHGPKCLRGLHPAVLRQGLVPAPSTLSFLGSFFFPVDQFTSPFAERLHAKPMLAAIAPERQTALALSLNMHLPPGPFRRIVEYSPSHSSTSCPERKRDDHSGGPEQCANIGRLHGEKAPWRDKSAATHDIFMVGNSGGYASDMVWPCRADLFENCSVSKARWRASGFGAAR